MGHPGVPTRDVQESGIDFFALGELKSSLRSIDLFQCRSERASLPLGEDREAGENPALPRNCKRGNCSRPLGWNPGKDEGGNGWW